MNRRTLFILLSFIISSLKAVACEYCSSYTTVCDYYEQQCTGYTQVCDSYSQQCTQYDSNGYCISYETVCDSYSTVCTGYQTVCTSSHQECDDYYYGQYVTIRGKMSNPGNGRGIGGVIMNSYDYESSVSTSVGTDANGNYQTRIFLYDDAYGYVSAQVCANPPANFTPSQHCQNVSAPDNCQEPTLTANDSFIAPTTGVLDIKGPYIFSGWALDPKSPNTNIEVHFYIDGPSGPVLVGSTVANQPRSDVNTVTGYPGNHGFTWNSTVNYVTTVTAYAVAVDNRYNPPIGSGTSSGSLVGATKAAVFGTDAGATANVRVVELVNNASLMSFNPFPAFTGGIRVALADMNADGTADIIAATGPGTTATVKVISGVNGSVLNTIYPYGGFTGGVFVATGDIDGDTRPDIITGADATGGPHVKVYSGATGLEIRSFFAYTSGFTGGVRVAAGDVDGDGKADIITGAGAGGGPHVKVFKGTTMVELKSFFAYDANFKSGIYVSAGDVDGDGKADIITGAGAGGGPHVKVFSGLNGSELKSYFAYSAGFKGGVRVGSTFLNADNKAEILTAAGPSGGPHFIAFSGLDLSVLKSFFIEAASMVQGLFVSGK